MGHLWRLKNKLRPKVANTLTALENKDGKLVTSGEEIKNVTLNHFRKVLSNRPNKSGLEIYQEER